MPKDTKTITLEIPDGPAPVFTEQLPSQPGCISGIASANAPFLFFDNVPYSAQAYGLGMLTLTAARFTSTTLEKVAPVDHVVVAHIRATIPALVLLRNAIDGLIEQVADTAEPKPMAPEPTPTAH